MFFPPINAALSGRQHVQLLRAEAQNAVTTIEFLTPIVCTSLALTAAIFCFNAIFCINATQAPVLIRHYSGSVPHESAIAAY
jgi:hypothetical protein